MVEFAIVATVLLFIIIGILYFGRFLSYTLDQNHLANIAARWAAVSQDPACTSSPCATPLYQYVQGLADPGEFQSGSTDVTQKAKVCISLPSGSSGNQGDPVQATVTATYHFLPFLNIPDIPVTESATMRLEAPMDSSDTQFLGCST